MQIKTRRNSSAGEKSLLFAYGQYFRIKAVAVKEYCDYIKPKLFSFLIGEGIAPAKRLLGALIRKEELDLPQIDLEDF